MGTAWTIAPSYICIEDACGTIERRMPSNNKEIINYKTYLHI
jgi:hypothetical protein